MKLTVQQSLTKRIVAFVAAAIMLGVSMVSCAAEPRVEITQPSGAPLTTVQVEVANDEAARELGLMYRNHLDPDAGMIFIFAAPQHLSFWMKNTEIPLDMVFAAADGRVVGIVENAHPFSEQTLSVDGDSQYVLEVNGGFCERHGVKAGDRLKFIGFAPRARS